MSEDLPNRRGRAPGRFVPTRKVRESVRRTKPVRETPIKRFDRKDMMERDLEKYRAEARARLLKNGFDIPAFLMPKPKINPDDEEGAEDADTLVAENLDPPMMAGPKPTPLVSNAQLAAAKNERPANRGQPNVKPSRFVYGQTNANGLVSMFLPDEKQQATGASDVVGAGGGQMTRPQDRAAHEAAQKAAIAEERSAYDDYVDSLNGGKTLLDRVQEKGASATEVASDIAGRVDELKETEVRKSRINLPDSDTNWALQDDLDAKRTALLQKQGKTSGRSSKGRKQPGQPISFNKMMARLAAYMIAAVAVGYVLVLTVNEFSAIIGR
jgi:hypothetical protein